MNSIDLQPPAADNIPANFDEWIEMHFGPTINKTFFHPYTRKVIEFLYSIVISFILQGMDSGNEGNVSSMGRNKSCQTSSRETRGTLCYDS